MALRTSLRLLALTMATAPLSCLLWDLAGPLPALVGLGLVGFILLYLVSLAGEGDLTCWQLRYHLTPGDDTDRLEELLHFLANRTGHLVVEADRQGLFLELPAAFDCYVEAQLPKALPELRLSRQDSDQDLALCASFFLCLGAPSSELLRWATEGESRQMRLHVHQGPYATLVARTGGEVPPGRWLRLPRLLRKLWHRLPLWDELSDGVRPGSLFPPTDDEAVYSSRSRLLQLVLPDGYSSDLAAGGFRVLGQSGDGRALMLSHDVPLFTVGAPFSFLVRQALDDLAAGRTIVVLSPHRRVLERIERGAGGSPIYWLDPRNSRQSIHLSIVSAAEWATVESGTVAHVTRTFLAGQGLDVGLPAVGDLIHRLLHALAELARQMGQDLTFTDLYAVSRSTQALKAFLTGAPGGAARGLLVQLDEDVGYVQAVTVLSAIRNALKPLGTGALHALCQPPFPNLGHILAQKALLLVPMTDADFPEHDRLLSAMLDLNLNRALATGDELNLSLHLHDPGLYRDDQGQRWIDVARRDARLALSLDVQDPRAYTLAREGEQVGEVLFRFSEALAPRVISDWGLPASVADLTELPTGTALARMPGMVVTLKAREE